MPQPPHLLDTNVFLHLAKGRGSEHALVKDAVRQLVERGTEICYTPQNVVEFWNVFDPKRETVSV